MVDHLTVKEVLTEGAARRTVSRAPGAAGDVVGATAVEARRLNRTDSPGHIEREAREEDTRVL